MQKTDSHRMRGDRFRLFLNVFHAAQYASISDDDRDCPGGLSVKRTRSVLRERFGFSDEMLERFPCCKEDIDGHCVGYAIAYFEIFMERNAEQLREAALDVDFMEELLNNHIAGNELGATTLSLIRSLMRAIATGELTEADFC